MVTDFAELLTQDEVDILVAKLTLMRARDGIKPSNDEILLLISWARAIRRNNALFNLFLMSENDELLIDANIDRATVNIVKLV